MARSAALIPFVLLITTSAAAASLTLGHRNTGIGFGNSTDMLDRMFPATCRELFFQRDFATADECFERDLAINEGDVEANLFRALSRILAVVDRRGPGPDGERYTDSLDEMLRGGGARRQTHRPGGSEVFDVDLVWPVDQTGRNPHVLRDLTEPAAVAAGRRPHHQEVTDALGHQGLHGVLPVLGRVTDVALAGLDEVREPGAQGLHDFAGFVHAQGRLGGQGQWCVRREFEVIGEPVSLTGAMALAKENPYQFQWWALGLVGARPAEQRKGADKGIDGRLYFHDEGKGGKTKQIILSVKSGSVSVSHIRDLRGVVEREEAALGVLITMLKPTMPMRAEAAAGGSYHSPGWDRQYPRLQILNGNQ